MSAPPHPWLGPAARMKPCQHGMQCRHLPAAMGNENLRARETVGKGVQELVRSSKNRFGNLSDPDSYSVWIYHISFCFKMTLNLDLFALSAAVHGLVLGPTHQRKTGKMVTPWRGLNSEKRRSENLNSSLLCPSKWYRQQELLGGLTLVSNHARCSPMYRKSERTAPQRASNCVRS